MNRTQFRDYESLSRAAAGQILSIVSTNPKARLCLATGSTPTRTYELLVDLVKEVESAFDSATVIKLDEWIGLEKTDPATCEHYLARHVITPLKISDDRYLAFASNAEDRVQECARVQERLDRNAPIDVCVLGLGTNGHLGFNEPGDKLEPHVHVAKLLEETRQHKMVRSHAVAPEYGYTIGIGDILRSRKILLLVSGEHKTAQLKRLLEPRIETKFPASFLWLHPNVDLYCDVPV